MFGACDFCGAPRGTRARLGVDREVLGYNLHCLNCGDLGPVPDDGPLRHSLNQSLLDAQVRAARHRCPLTGDRRARPLDPPRWEGDAAEHRRSAAKPHALENFNGDTWEPVGVAADEVEVMAWFHREDADLREPWHRFDADDTSP